MLMRSLAAPCRRSHDSALESWMERACGVLEVGPRERWSLGIMIYVVERRIG